MCMWRCACACVLLLLLSKGLPVFSFVLPPAGSDTPINTTPTRRRRIRTAATATAAAAADRVRWVRWHVPASVRRVAASERRYVRAAGLPTAVHVDLCIWRHSCESTLISFLSFFNVALSLSLSFHLSSSLSFSFAWAVSFAHACTHTHTHIVSQSYHLPLALSVPLFVAGCDALWW